MYNKMEEIHDELITLVDEEGQEHQFMVLDVIMVNEHKYAIMIPALTEAEAEEINEDEEETEAVIFRFDADEENLILVEDEEEFTAVAEEWEKLVTEYEENMAEEE